MTCIRAGFIANIVQQSFPIGMSSPNYNSRVQEHIYWHDSVVSCKLSFDFSVTSPMSGNMHQQDDFIFRNVLFCFVLFVHCYTTVHEWGSVELWNLVIIGNLVIMRFPVHLCQRKFLNKHLRFSIHVSHASFIPTLVSMNYVPFN
jgi:hypothetical protein